MSDRQERVDATAGAVAVSKSGALDERRRLINHRAAELERAGAGRHQGYVLALEEAWRAEALENERLWDQADEIEGLKEENKRLRGYVSVIASGMPREDLLEIERALATATAPQSPPPFVRHVVNRDAGGGV